MKLFESKKVKKWTASLVLPAVVLSAALVFFPGSSSAHCDSIDGPVVLAAKKALEKGNVNYVLPYIYKDGEHEVIEAFEKTMEARKSFKAREVVDHWFYETAVRVHREGEGAPYTGLQPAGLDYGPALPAAEEAIETGNVDELKELILHTVEAELDKKFAEVIETPKATSVDQVDVARERVEKELLFEKYIFELYSSALAELSHGHGGDAEGHSEEGHSADAEPAEGEHSH